MNDGKENNTGLKNNQEPQTALDAQSDKKTDKKSTDTHIPEKQYNSEPKHDQFNKQTQVAPVKDASPDQHSEKKMSDEKTAMSTDKKTVSDPVKNRNI